MEPAWWHLTIPPIRSSCVGRNMGSQIGLLISMISRDLFENSPGSRENDKICAGGFWSL
jgi:hypothetical protein